MKKIVLNNKIYNLSLDYILGLWEGDGSIYIQLKPNQSHKTGKQVILNWDIHQHVIDVDLLHAIKIFLDCGKVEVGKKTGNPDSWVYRFRISRQTEILNILLPVLESNTMVLNKRNHDLNLFINACKIVKNKYHTTKIGLDEIIEINNQLSSRIDKIDKALLPDSTTNLNSLKVTGLTDAEGSFSVFYVNIKKQYQFSFSIAQEKTEIKFLNNLIKFFGCGNVSISDEKGLYYVTSKKDLIEKIIPFFEKNKLQTIKQYSFLNFQKILNIVLNNKPMLKNHLDEINSILEDKTYKRPIN